MIDDSCEYMSRSLHLEQAIQKSNAVALYWLKPKLTQANI